MSQESLRSLLGGPKTGVDSLRVVKRESTRLMAIGLVHFLFASAEIPVFRL